MLQRTQLGFKKGPDLYWLEKADFYMNQERQAGISSRSSRRGCDSYLKTSKEWSRPHEQRPDGKFWIPTESDVSSGCRGRSVHGEKLTDISDTEASIHSICPLIPLRWRGRVLQLWLQGTSPRMCLPPLDGRMVVQWPGELVQNFLQPLGESVSACSTLGGNSKCVPSFPMEG